MNTKLAIPTILCGLALLSAAATVNAASPCKGLSENACSADPACGWTKAYTRKDGKEVAAYCRTKARPKAAASASTAATGKPKG